MVATPRAEALSAPVRAALAQVRDALRGPPAFEPATSRRRFVVATHDLLLPTLARIVPRVAREAPGVQIQLQGPLSELELETLEDPIAFATLALARPPSWVHHPLAPMRWSTFARPGHPIARDPSLRRWLDAPHVQVRGASGHENPVESVLAEQGTPRQVLLHVPHFLGALHLVRGSDLLLTAPEPPLRSAAEALGLICVAPPLRLPAIGGALAWPRRLDADAGHRWLRGILLDALSPG